MDPTISLHAILALYSRRNPGKTELQNLQAIDQALVPTFIEGMTLLEPDKRVLDGFVARAQSIDNRLAELGHPQFKNHERLAGALGYFSKPETTVEEALEWVHEFESIRAELWKTVQ